MYSILRSASCTYVIYVTYLDFDEICDTPRNFQEETAGRGSAGTPAASDGHTAARRGGAAHWSHMRGHQAPRSQGALAGAGGTQQQQESRWEVKKNGPQRPCTEL